MKLLAAFAAGLCVPFAAYIAIKRWLEGKGDFC